MTRFKFTLDLFVSVLVVVTASLVIWRHLVPSSGRSQSRPRVESATGLIPAEMARIVRGTGQVAIVEFSDFQCPFCGQYARDVDPMIRKAFVDTGVVRQVFLNYPLASHPRAQAASEAAMCAGSQGSFWEMHDALFRNQTALADTDLADRGLAIGLNMAMFTKCLGSGEHRAAIEQHKRVAREFSVQATPAFLLGIAQSDGSVELKKRVNGALAFDEFRSAIIDVTPGELRTRVVEVALNRLSSTDRSLRGDKHIATR